MRHFSKLLGALAILLLFLVALGPYLTNGFWSDDSLNSMVRGWVEMKGITLSEFIQSTNREWIRNSSRIFPLSLWVGYTSYYVFPTVEYFRLYHVTMALLSVGTFAWLVADLGGNRPLALMASLLSLVFFQIRSYHDPLASYGPLLQTCMLTLTGTLIFFRISLRRPNERRFIALACASLAWGLFTYETALGTAFLAVFMLPVGLDWKTRVRRLLPLFAVMILYLAIVLTLRATNPSSYAGTSVSHNFQAIRRATGRQLSAAFPFSYFRHQLPELRFSELALRILNDAFDLGLGLAASLAFGFALFHFAKRRQIQAKWRLLALGVGLALYPSILIGLSSRYQGEVAWGLGYLPVYLSYFGVILVTTLLIGTLLRFARGIFGHLALGIMSLVFGFGVALNHEVNAHVATRMNPTYLYPRQLLEDGLREGLFDELHEGDWIVSEIHFQWFRAELFYSFIPRKINVVTRAELRDGALFNPTPEARVYNLDFSSENAAAKWILLRKISPSPENYIRLRVDSCGAEVESLKLFLRTQANVSVQAKSGGPTWLAPQSEAQAPKHVDNWLRRLYSPSRQAERITVLQRENPDKNSCALELKSYN